MRRGERRDGEGKKGGKERGEMSDLPCERLFLDLVQILEGLFREKPLQSLGRGSEMPRDAGSLEQAVRRHGRCRYDDASTVSTTPNGGRIIRNFRCRVSHGEARRPREPSRRTTRLANRSRTEEEEDYQKISLAAIITASYYPR